MIILLIAVILILILYKRWSGLQDQAQDQGLDFKAMAIPDARRLFKQLEDSFVDISIDDLLQEMEDNGS